MTKELIKQKLAAGDGSVDVSFKPSLISNLIQFMERKIVHEATTKAEVEDLKIIREMIMKKELPYLKVKIIFDYET